ncbi:hypothetical protein E2C01_043225 [Portunus trituberculatus]|uniref:Uncharacterized protein n=1 Tax=Portunus trituberculatus TaxID=210409 RepID=A0A5B7FV54_PORTR|nr:hypothetical protein [Portunus trituberculatus]
MKIILKAKEGVTGCNSVARGTTAADLWHLLAAGSHSQHPYSWVALPLTGSDALAVVRSVE